MSEEKEKKKTMVEKIKEIFKADEEVQTEENFVDVKTDSGVILRVDDIAVDQAVQEVTEEGLVDVADSTYVLEDGTGLVVVGGVITEIVETEAEAKAETEEEMETEEVEDSNKFEDELISTLKSVNDRLTAIENKFKAVEKENKELKEDFKKIGGQASDSHTETKIKFKQEKEIKKTPLHYATGH